MPRLRSLVLLPAVAFLACCGGSPQRAAAPAAPPRFLSVADLETQLGNGFRHGLDRLAVMSQPPEGAADLGQSLPTGALDDVRCAAAGTRPAGRAPWPWRCTVGWETAGGRGRTTKYAVRLLPTGCFAAAADPALPPHRDPTIASFTEHPLNGLASARKGC
jgi:hypothetical protein